MAYRMTRMRSTMLMLLKAYMKKNFFMETQRTIRMETHPSLR